MKQRTGKGVLAIAVVLLATVSALPASAAMAVIDIRAIGQLRQQLSLARQHLSTLQQELNQLRATHQALTGPRGMQGLMGLTPDERNYLPGSWNEWAAVLAGTSARYGTLARQIEATIEAGAVLPPGRVAQLSAAERDIVETRRRQVAWQAVTLREAYGQASARFASLNQLVSAIGGAGDAKAIADLQARIGAEQAMLANEQAKLELVAQMAAAEAALQAGREREAALAGHGQFAARFQPTLR